MADEEPAIINNNVINWNVDLEVSLFHAMHDHKPVGLNRHFQMVFIHDKLNSSVSKKIPISSSEIWKHLTELYDLQALHDSERIPFPNKEVDFGLPPGSFDDLMSRDFPRSVQTILKVEPATKECTPTAASKETTDVKPSGAIPKSSKGSSQPTKSDESPAANEKLVELSKTDEYVKSDRKRTRHSIQQTAGDSSSTSTPGSTKRVRRT